MEKRLNSPTLLNVSAADSEVLISVVADLVMLVFDLLVFEETVSGESAALLEDRTSVVRRIVDMPA